ncbi:MAG TPA: AMP-binding protein [Jatrophihabitans sp.]|nr:AMP-binding protein [Jatrophihabitans sp.]
MRREQMRTEPTGTSLPVLAEQTWSRYGDQLVTVFEGERWSADRLAERSWRFAGGLTRLGLRPGDRLVVCMANCLEVGISYHAGWRAGAVVTPVLFLLTETELAHVLVDSQARLIVTTPEFLPKVVAAAANAPELRAIVVAGDIPDPGATPVPVLPFAELADAEPAPLVDTDPSGLAALLYTGGTTGRAKGVMLSHDALSAAGWSATMTGIDEQMQSSLLPLPLAHVYGLMVSTMQLHMSQPMTSVLMRWFDPASWLALAQAERVNTSPVVPTMLRLLLQHPLEDYDLSALRRLTSGSAPLPAEVRLEWNRRQPHIEIVEGYGCTETAAIISSCPLDVQRAGSVGLPAPIAEVGIDTGEGPAQAADVDGEICVRGPMLLSGYWGDTEPAVVDGWFHTGDVGRLDADGFLYIVDRIKDVIIRDGFNVYPRDIEEALLTHPAVLNCAVIGRPDERHGEVPVAFVELRPGAGVSTDELREYAKSQVSAAKYPREIRIVDQVPLTSVGKVDRKRLRTLAD